MPTLQITAVFDTNNLVRLALAKTRASQRMLTAVKSELFGLVMSDSTLAEIERVLNYPRIKVPQ